jgi:riboflavin synthase
MFTGLIESMGTVVALTAGTQTRRLVLDLGTLAEGLRIGDSVAVDGCCLTAMTIAGPEVTFEAVPETLRKTTLGLLKPGSKVNLERAVLPSTRMGGHFVQGHIDGRAQVTHTVPGERWAEWHFKLQTPELVKLIVPKGSIAIDGISLTVAGFTPTEERFWVALIPETLARTTLGGKGPGSRVNIESDILGRYLLHFIEHDRRQEKSQNVLNETWLRERGY